MIGDGIANLLGLALNIIKQVLRKLPLQLDYQGYQQEFHMELIRL